MRIRAFHIDGFGILSQVTVENMPAGMSIFLGNNEAGKSICLEFFRTMLTGYPLPLSRESKKDWAAAGPRQGGSLQFTTLSGVTLRLVRQPGPGGGILGLHDAQSNPLDVTELDRLLGGVTREVYRNIYGFSLSELQTFESLDNEAVRNALYGAGFGLGLNTPSLALGRMQEGMDSLFKPGGKNPPLNVALHQWDELKREMREAKAETARYDVLAGEFAGATEHLNELRGEKAALEDERRGLERRQNVWKQWEEWRLAKARLERLELVVDTFPPDGPARLDRLLECRDAALRQTALSRELLNRLHDTLQRLKVDPRLLSMVEDVRALSEHKSSCRGALVALPSLRAQMQRAGESLDRQLAALGPGWTMERIRTMDRSLFMREEMERHAAAMQTADTEVLTLSASMERAVRDFDQAKNSAELSRRTLEVLPEPAAGLAPEIRNILHTQLLRVEEAKQRLPEREKALAAARAEYERTLAYLHLRPDRSGSLLNLLESSQEQALNLAEEVRICAEKAVAAARDLAIAHKEEETVRNRLQRLQAQSPLSGMDRKMLDNRRSGLRRLRQSSTLAQQEEERLADLTERFATQEASLPRAHTNMPFLMGGIALSLFGIVLFTLRYVFSLFTLNVSGLWSHLSSSPPPAWASAVPLEPWAAYLVLVVGLILAYLGRPHAGPDQARSESLLDQLRSRREASAARLEELRGEIRFLCESLGAAGIDPNSLDELEARMDQDRETWFVHERLVQEGSLIQAELDAKRRQSQTANMECSAAESAVQGARRRWHDYMLGMGVVTVPLPEMASAYFARV